ncbi:hypothetical protein GCM10022223_48510 [Kineosporia mesophila]|uniref:Uncharacterized protein n=1 Tax=Kineosporia mesophila TaxID=566012 RepID=A0ABP7A675_9ACTN|nr:hypothetical protein [Kineosporia mesophila]MCD5351542.1 hypothetical protein [Kineosporia mesophila]
MDLDVLDSGQVTGHMVLRADLGVLGRQLVVLSGIANPGWEVDGDEVQRDVCRVLLRETAEQLEQATVHVGLSSVANEDTSFVFATDQATLETGPDGLLVLVTNLAVQGEPSTLQGFSYQVVLTKRVVTTEISGTISWPTAWLRPPSPTPAGISGVFTILANLRTTTTGPGPFGGEIEHLVPVTPGEILSVTIAGDTCHAIYRITEPPKNAELRVMVTQNGLPGTVLMASTVAGSDIFTLTPVFPTRTGVDFHAIAPRAPK